MEDFYSSILGIPVAGATLPVLAYSSILGIPVAGATLPVLAFLSLAVYGKNIILGVAVLILGIGHIGIHLIHKKEIGK